ncbi:MAG TPA: Hsp20/alpha crystallin family protein [bacterium]|nr:Hsp20/alpha crystallin family protein [bacterium]HNS34070.1 Hsp20/alpha crystallin family protein [bacterium]HNW09040.1 Hsp20/alpha crystallin family protein [bacterium]HPN81073.1 Hsp20/alpha crystallin family protein [bacterium]HPW39181.1 Hsp20/alpha crystallin family protein [bacterium]
MSLIKWSPFWADEWDNWPFTQDFAPALDIYQDKDSLVVEAPLAGINPDKVEIAVENDVMTIKGEVERQSEVEEKDYYRREVRSGSFYRAVQLPTHVLGDQADATYEKGILKITIPRAPESKPKKIEIKSK